MTKQSRRTILGMSAASLFPRLAFPEQATADEYPNHTINYVVPFAPSGYNYLVARLISEELQLIWKPKKVSLRSIPGKNGRSGVEQARAKNFEDNGYTLLQISATNFNYDALLDDFTVISVVAQTPLVICVNSASDLKTYQDLCNRLDSRNTNDTTYIGSPGEGSWAYMVFQELAAASPDRLSQMKHISYSGGAPAIANLLANNVELVISNLPECIAFLQRGWLRGLAITQDDAFKLGEVGTVPGLQVLKEPALKATNWTALMAKVKKDDSTFMRLNFAVKQAIMRPEFNERLNDCGVQPIRYDQDISTKFLYNEKARWKKKSGDLNLKLKTD